MTALVDFLASLLRRLFGGAQAPAAPEAAPSYLSPLSAEPPPPEPPVAAGPRRINAAGLALVKESEGLRLEAYQDSVGVWTIGYGHTGPAAGPGLTIDGIGAAQLLTADLLVAERAVSAQLAADGWSEQEFTDNEFSALVDFTFNLGAGALRQLLAHGLDQVPEQLLRWDHAGGVELAGLKLRRQREGDLWRTA